MFYRICTHCGSHLDPQERCSCREEKEVQRTVYERLTRQGEEGQLELVLPAGHASVS